MEANTKVKWLSAVVGVCLVTIGLLGYYALTTKDKIDSLQAQSDTRLSAPALAFSDPQPGTLNPIINPQIMNPNNGTIGMLGNFQDLQKRMDDMMSRVFSGQSMFNQQDINSFFGPGMSTPEVSITESTNEYQVIVKVPEGQSIELNTEVSDNVLKISGEVKDSTESNNGNMIQKSYSSSHFSQTLSLSEPVIESAMKTEHEGNDIIIHIPKQKS